jgi:nucleoside-diphosphate-sugar epimerase
MNIVITGGSGFIGTRLVGALLAAGHHVRIFDQAASARYPDRVWRGDVRDAAAVTSALERCDWVIHLAAEHRDDVRPSSRYVDVNVGGTRVVLHAAEACEVTRVLYVSSAAVYGLAQPDADESTPLHPQNPYGESKASAESLCLDWVQADAEKRRLVILRPCVVFGEGNRGNVYHLIDQIRRRRFAMIGDGSNRKSIAYVGNLVDFMLQQIDVAPGLHLYNYADKPDPNMRELVALIHELLGRPDRRWLRVPYLGALAAAHLGDLWSKIGSPPLRLNSERVRKFCADTRISTRALDGLGFSPRTPLRAALAATIAQLDDQGDLPGTTAS